MLRFCLKYVGMKRFLWREILAFEHSEAPDCYFLHVCCFYIFIWLYYINYSIIVYYPVRAPDTSYSYNKSTSDLSMLLTRYITVT